jgi:hypothetical protein
VTTYYEKGYRAGIAAAVVELRRQADGWRRPITPSKWTERSADAFDEAADVVESLAPPLTPGEPLSPESRRLLDEGLHAGREGRISTPGDAKAGECWVCGGRRTSATTAVARGGVGRERLPI